MTDDIVVGTDAKTGEPVVIGLSTDPECGILMATLSQQAAHVLGMDLNVELWALRAKGVWDITHCPVGTTGPEAWLKVPAFVLALHMKSLDDQRTAWSRQGYVRNHDYTNDGTLPATHPCCDIETLSKAMVNEFIGRDTKGTQMALVSSAKRWGIAGVTNFNFVVQKLWLAVGGKVRGVNGGGYRLE